MNWQADVHDCSPALRPISLAICLIFSLGMVAASHAAEGPSPSKTESLVSVADFDLGSDYAGIYLSGDVAGAVALAERDASGADDPVGRSSIYFDLLYMCDSIDNFACVEAALFGLLSTLEEIDGASREDLRRQAQVWIARYDIWRGEYERAVDLVRSLNQQSQYEFSKTTYLILQDVTQWIARAETNYPEARRAASRLVMRMLWDPTFVPLQKAQYLSDVLQSLLFSGDSFGALRFYESYDDFIVAELQGDTIGLATYLSFSASLNAQNGNLIDANARAELSRSVLSAAALPQAAKDNFLSDLDNLEAVSSLFTGDIDSAQGSAETNPWANRREELIARGRFTASEELLSTVVDLLVQRVSGDTLDARLAPLFEQPVRLSYFGLEENYFEPYRLFGRGLLHASQREDGGEDIASAAVLQLMAAEERQRSFAVLYPLPDIAEKIAVGMAIAGLAQNDSLSNFEQNLIVSGFDYLARTPRQFAGDSMQHVSRLQSAKERRRFQSYLRLSSRNTALELAAVRLALQPETEEIAAQKIRLAAALSEISDAMLQLNAGSSGPAPPGVSASEDTSWLADVSEIRRYLDEDEAIIANVVSFGSLNRICIRKDDFYLKITPGTEEMGAQAVADSRILRAALTATHAPSEILDSQYPVHAALRMHDFLLSGLDACLDGVAQISYVPLYDMSDIPLQALLEREPPQVPQGYDLANADWVARKYAITYLNSVREYVAAARLAERAQAGSRFLGVGDPVLESGVVPLSELPETGAELRAMQESFPDVTLLTREEATELRLRSEYLESYSVMSFATHGVTSGELPGYYSPGLVLTPEPAGGNLIAANGFLSAEEIASLSLNARLVILSGCNTGGLDPALFGTGVSGLAEAFSIAGVPSVIASLWSVDSRATAELMTFLFRELSQNPGDGVSRNLFNAIDAFWQNTDNPAYYHPRFWAAFVAFGAGKLEASVERVSDEPARGILSFDRTDDGGGPFEDFDALADGRLVLARQGGAQDGLPISHLELFDAAGGLQWQISDRGGIGGARIVATADSILIAAYGFAAPGEAGAVTPLVRAYDFDGNLIWEWTGEAIAQQSLVQHLPRPVLNLDSGGMPTVLFARDAPDQGQLNLDLVRFDSSGNGAVLWTLGPLNIGEAVASVNYSQSPEGPLLLVSVSPTVGVSAIAAGPTNPLGIPSVCFPESFTHAFSSPSFEELPVLRGTYRYLFVTKTRSLAGKVIAAGRIDAPCNTGALWYGWFGEITPQTSTPAYVEAGLPGSSFNDFSVEAENVLLLGHWRRRYGEILRPIVIANRYVAGEREAFESDETFLTVIENIVPSEQGAEPSLGIQEFLGTGLSTVGTAVHVSGETARIWGQVGGNPFTADFVWP